MREPLATLDNHTPTLSFEQPIPRRLVHRAANAEVFVTDGARRDDNRFAVAAQWPRDHALYHPGRDRRHDPLLIAETVRQALVYIAHRYQGVPHGHRFVGQQTGFTITDAHALRVRASPAAVVLDTRWTWCDPGSRRSRMRLDAALSIDDQPCGHGWLTATALDERRYTMIRWRGHHPDPRPSTPSIATAVAPEAVGRLRAKDSVIAATDSATRWQLMIDPEHAILFDHAVDHVPLMVLLEGARQLGHLLVNRCARSSETASLIGLQTDLLAFAELTEPIHLVLRSHHHDSAARQHTLHLNIEQQATPIATLHSTWQTGTRPGPSQR